MQGSLGRHFRPLRGGAVVVRVNLSNTAVKEFRVGTAVANLCAVRAQEPTKLGNGRSGAAEVGAALPRRARRKRLFLEPKVRNPTASGTQYHGTQVQ